MTSLSSSPVLQREAVARATAIALDGPAGSGKSTMARALAKELQYHYVDTGAFYRTVSFACLAAGLDSRDGPGIVSVLPALRIRASFDDAGLQHMFVGEQDVTGQIRTEPISKYTSDISVFPEVREKVTALLREMAEAYDVIMDGRDIGTVVLPEAQVKLFLTADDRERARRRVEQLRAAGESADFDTVLADLRYRDRQDSTRAAAPLQAARDAVVVSTSDMDEPTTLRFLKKLILDRLGYIRGEQAP